MHAKEQPQEELQKQVLAQVDHEMGGDSLDGILRTLGNVGLRAMLEASGMAKQSHIVSGADSLACAKQVSPVFRLARYGPSGLFT